MGSSQRTELALNVLYYLSPVTVLLYFFLASLASACTLQAATKRKRRTTRKIINWLILLILTTYIGSTVILLLDTFGPAPQIASAASNVYSISSVLVWFTLFTSLVKTRSPVWYPFHGSWLLTFLFEIAILSFLISPHPRQTLLLYSLITVQGLRIAALLFLLAVLASASRNVRSLRLGLESKPLIGDDRQQRSGQPATLNPQNGYGSMSAVAESGSSDEDDESDNEDPKKKKDMEIIKKRLKEKGNWIAYFQGFLIFFPYVWPSKKSLLQVNVIGVTICLLSIRVLNVLEPRQLGLVIDSLVVGGAMPYKEVAIYIVLAWALSSGVESVREFLWIPVDQHTHKALITAAYNHIMNLSCDFHDNKQSGELYATISQGSSILELLELFLFKLAPILMDLIVAYWYLHYLFGPYMTLLGAATTIVFLWVTLFLNNKQRRLRRKYIEIARKMSQQQYDTVGSWSVVAYFNRIAYEQGRYSAVVNQHMQTQAAYMFLSYFTWAVQAWLLDVGLYGALLLATYQIVHGTRSVGDFATLLLYWSRFTGPLSFLGRAHKMILGFLIDAERLLQIFQTQPSIKDGSTKFVLKDGIVRFDHVSFSYDGQKPIIQDLTFATKSGQKVAIVGETGSGKSTLLKLLFRFYDVNSGLITIDGQDVQNVTLESLRDVIGVVPQNPSLFNDTIISNVRYSRLEATDEEVMSACKAAAIHDKILSFTDGYSSKVGEKGVKLSGGELQRVAIARAILKDPKIVLLDEATSSVDTDTESKIQEALTKLTKGRTTFIVAHRLSTVVDADWILVIKDGAVFEEGAPAELLMAKGKYFDLWSKQVGITSIPPGVLQTHKKGLFDEATEGDQAKSGSNEASKTWRPDAPEFIPQHLRNSAQVAQTTETTHQGQVGRSEDSSLVENRPTNKMTDSFSAGGQLGADSSRQNLSRDRSQSELTDSNQRQSQEETGSNPRGPCVISERVLPNQQGQRQVSASDEVLPISDCTVSGHNRRRRRQKPWLKKSQDDLLTQSDASSSKDPDAPPADPDSQLPVKPGTTICADNETSEAKNMQTKGYVRFAPDA